MLFNAVAFVSHTCIQTVNNNSYTNIPKGSHMRNMVVTKIGKFNEIV